MTLGIEPCCPFSTAQEIKETPPPSMPFTLQASLVSPVSSFLSHSLAVSCLCLLFQFLNRLWFP